MLFNRNFADLITFTRASARWRFSSGGVLVQDAANAPSLDYDPITLAARGLLVEELRTNLLLQSEAFDAVTWGKVTASVSANVAASPSGTTTADKFVEDTSAAPHQLTQAIGVTSGTTYTTSVYARAGERALLQLNYSGYVGANFNLLTGAVNNVGTANANFNGYSASILPMGNGWYRCSVTQTCIATLAGSQRLYVGDTPTFSGTAPPTYTGDGASGLYLWGAQMEVGAFATSYVPTTTAQATRAADSAAITDLTKIGFNPSEGTIYAEVLVPSGVATVGAAGIVALHDGSISNRMVAYFTGGNARILAAIGGTAQSFSVGAAPAVGAVCKLAFAYRANDFAASMNGAAAVPWALSGVPSVNALRLGGTNQGVGSEALNSWLRNVRYYPRRMTNAELQSLTT
ncbi:hypothetical protein [Cupriavidus sp. UME77]|uniref:phage head spike fiber domain-containing protein n=1 Tax=Cupriavidus sp. UME77 TaxID=1862321 RepID=UPI00160018A9|nr:hypothetical protein [Cupriavidus sp. UME77]MBB1630323.1 hypothetical protein [Cupriavidus sp. UME77]